MRTAYIKSIKQYHKDTGSGRQRIFYTLISVILRISFIFLIPTYGNTESVCKNDGPVPVQKKIWSEAGIIKDVLVSYLDLRERMPELKKDADFYPQLLYLLFLFDSMSSENALEILANLSSYYLGSAGGEIYHCLLIRKGIHIEKHLRTLLESDCNECISRFGKKSKICLSNDQYKSEIRIILKLIKEKESCILEY